MMSAAFVLVIVTAVSPTYGYFATRADCEQARDHVIRVWAEDDRSTAWIRRRAVCVGSIPEKQQTDKR